MAVLLKAIKSGTHADRMNPQVADGELTLLEGFDFNPVSLLQHVFTPSYSVETDNEGKQVLVKIPAFIAGKSALQLPTRFTHFKLTPMAVAFDFESGEYLTTTLEPCAPVTLSGDAVQPVVFTADIQPSENTVTILAIGIEFYQSVNGWDEAPVAAGGYDVLGVVKVVRGLS